MPGDDPIPSFLSLSLPRSASRGKRAAATARRPTPKLAPAPLMPMLFDLDPPPAAKPASSPVPEPLAKSAFLPQTLYTVRQLIAELRRHVEGLYTGLIHVEGEISNCRPATSGHLYFTLKDGDAQLPVVMFRRQAQLLGFKIKDGLAVEARGRISVYETRGQLQLIAEHLRPRGSGALQLAFEQLRDRLRREGLFDRPRQPLPAFPHCIGIVTSPHGAAIRDIIQIVRRRHARLNLLIYPAAMQGSACAATVAAGIRWFNRQTERRTAHQVDLILITRGGGSLEDLAGFNEERLARTIVASTLPVVAAIGHEIDHTIAEYVADLRAPTPSAAAELITAAQHRIEERVLALERRVHRAGDYHLLRARRRLERLSAGYVLARLRDSIGQREQKIDELRLRLEAAAAQRARTRQVRLAALEARLRRQDPTLRLALAQRRLLAIDERIKRLPATLLARRQTRLDGAVDRLARLPQRVIALRQARLERASVRLHAMSPLAVLNRGYAIVYAEGRILRDAADAAPGTEVRTRLARGHLTATVIRNDEQ